jgi:hypothetical protein
MKPVAIRSNRVARPHAGGLVVLGQNHRVDQLDAVAAWIWTHADGSRDVDSLLMGLRAEVDGDASRSVVFEALDRLADADLLEKRVAPPAGVSRRGLLQRLGGAAALAALTAVVGIPAGALAAAPQCDEEQTLLSEIAWLEAEVGGVAELLDTWLDEAIADDTTDAFYVEKLGAKEREYKKKQSLLAEQRQDATLDLADCNVAGKKKKLSEQEEKRKDSYQMREQRSEQQAKKATSQLKKKVDASIGREQNAKVAIKQKLEANTSGSADEQSAKAEWAEDVLARKVRQEERAKQQHQMKYEAGVDQRFAAEKERKRRLAQASSNLDGKLVSAEEKQKLFADAFASKASEEASKSAGVDSRVQEIAQEEALKASFAGEAARKDYEASIAGESKTKQAEEGHQKSQEKEAKVLSFQEQDSKASQEKDSKYQEAQMEQKVKQASAEQQQKATF